jgi:hypothetical protein
MTDKLPADPRDWPDEIKLEHSMRMAEKLIDQHPQLAAVWLRSADILRARLPSKA